MIGKIQFKFRKMHLAKNIYFDNTCRTLHLYYSMHLFAHEAM